MVYLKISKVSQENTCARFFFNKAAGKRLQLYYKSDSGTGVYSALLNNNNKEDNYKNLWKHTVHIIIANKLYKVNV